MILLKRAVMRTPFFILSKKMTRSLLNVWGKHWLAQAQVSWQLRAGVGNNITHIIKALLEHQYPASHPFHKGYLDCL